MPGDGRERSIYRVRRPCGWPSALHRLQRAGADGPAGRLLASNCFQCHGTDGKGPGFERLAGKSANDIYHELVEMRAGEEGDGLMAGMRRATPMPSCAPLRSTSPAGAEGEASWTDDISCMAAWRWRRALPWPSCGGGGGDGTSRWRSRSPRRHDRDHAPLAPPAHPKARVIVIGGGMAGVTVAKYLRLWGDAIDVTLVERAPSLHLLHPQQPGAHRAAHPVQPVLRLLGAARLATACAPCSTPSRRSTPMPPASRSRRVPCSRPTASCLHRASTSTRCPD